MKTKGKTHVHSEQFDGSLHAWCCAGSSHDGTKVVVENDFAAIPYADRCRKCAADQWPRGGEPK
jgi:hypothetical protein